MRTPRAILPDHTLVEVSQRTVRGQHLLRPDRELNEIFLGVLGRAQRLHPVQIVAAVCLSNHFHLLLEVEDTRVLARFMGYLAGNLAKEVNRLRGLSGPVWQRRYSMVPVTPEPAAQVRRFRYLLAQGVKENLVQRCRQWPGIHTAKHYLEGAPWTGYWFDRTRESEARNRGERVRRYRFGRTETVHLSPLPCLAHLSEKDYRRWVLETIREVEKECDEERRREGGRVLGAKAVLRQDPLAVSDPPAPRPLPVVHAASRRSYQAFRRALRELVSAYREASRTLRLGGSPTFPAGCFPPALPFVAADAARAP